MISTDEEHALGIPGSMLGRCAAVESRKECALGMPDSTVGTCAAAADPAAIADAFLRENPELQHVYYRLTHDQGSVDGKMAQWEQIAVLKEFLRPYILAVDERAYGLARKMVHERGLVISAAKTRSR